MDPNKKEVAQLNIAPELVAVGSAKASTVNLEFSNIINKQAQANEAKKGLRIATEKPVDIVKRDKTRDQIGIPKPDGSHSRAAGSPEEKRYKIADEIDKTLTAYLDRGYDNLDSNNTINVRMQNELRDVVSTELFHHPVMSEAIIELAMHPPADQEFIERQLRDPDFRQHVQQIYESRLNTVIDDSSVLNADQALQDKKEQTLLRKAELDRAEQTKIDNQKIIDDAADPAGEYQKLQLSKLKDDGDYQDLIAEKEILDVQIASYQKQYESALGKNPNQSLQLSALSELKRLKHDKSLVEVTMANSNKVRRQQLEQDLSEAKKQAPKLEEIARNKKAEHDKAVRDEATADGVLTQAKKVREAEEEMYVDSLGTVMSEATQKYINQQIQEKEQLLQRGLQEKEANAKEQIEQEFYAILQKRWAKKQTTGWRKGRYIYNKTEITSDFDKLMSDGPTKVFYDVISSRATALNIPHTDMASLAKELKARGVNVDQMQKDLTSQLLQKKIATGGLRKREVEVITGTKWGGDAINEALANNTIFRKAVEQLAEQRGIKGVWKRAREIVRSKPWLLTLLAAPIVVAYAAAKSASEEVG